MASWLPPLLLAFVAALGNAVFAYAQKKAVYEPHFLMIAFCATIAAIGAWCIVLFSNGSVHWQQVARQPTYAVLGGMGLLFTIGGFNYLFAKYGTSYYVVYAALSILTTTVVVGWWLFKEPLNFFHKISVVFAVLTVVFFSIGRYKTH